MATQQEKTGQKRLKKPSTSAMILLLFAITVVSFSGITLSKYILQVDSKEQLVTATEFYFESDLLSESSYPTYTMEYRDSLTIDLKNYLDDLNVSAETISYDVTVAVDGVVAEDITVTKGALTAGAMVDAEVEIDLTTFASQANPTVQVTVTSTSPYRKVLSGYFVLDTSASGGPTFTTQDFSSSTTVLLTLKSNNYTGDLTVTIPDGTQPNNGDGRLSVTADNSFQITVAKNSEYQIYIFKTTPTALYSADDFMVSTAATS